MSERVSSLRAAADKALPSGEERWRAIFQNSRIGVALVGPDRHFLLTNARFQELVGYTEAELRQMTVLELTHPDDRAEHEKAASEIRTGRRKDVQIEKRYLRKGGGIVWVRSTAFLAPCPEGTTPCAIALVEDITDRKLAEERLRKQERQFLDAQRVAHFGSWEWDPVADVSVWSEELYRILGLEPGSFRPDLGTYLTWVLPDDREFVRSAIEGAMAGGTNIEYETRIMRPDGSTGIIRIYGVPVFDRSGAVARFVGVTQDITERRQAELDALEKERRLRLAFDQMQAMLWTTDLELRLTSVHGASLQPLGREPKDVVGTPIADYFSSADSTEVAPHRRALAGEHAEYETSRGGQPLQVRVDPLRDEEGNVVGVIGVAVDISEQRRAEELLRESEARYRLLFEFNPSPMWVIDEETFRFLAVNNAAVRHYGYSREEFLSMKATDIRSPEEVVRWKEHFHTRSEIYERGVWRHLKKDGAEIEVEVVARAIDFAGRPARLALVRDVTERRRAEERLARSAHEMRTLTARLQTIRDEESARIAREVHDEVGQALTALAMDVAWLGNQLGARDREARLPAKLQDMAQLLETTSKSVERIASDLRPAVLDELGLEAAAQWAVRRFEERTKIPCRFESLVTGTPFDPLRATAAFKILQEALTNISRHAHARQVSVQLYTDEAGLHLEVQDDGVGIDPPRIGDSRSFGLLGMRERARAFDGNCVIAGRPTGGTTVSATIPLSSRQAFESARPLSRSDTAGGRRKDDASDSDS
jgi:PAS domain S-box-containing protein